MGKMMVDKPRLSRTMVLMMMVVMMMMSLNDKVNGQETAAELCPANLESCDASNVPNSTCAAAAANPQIDSVNFSDPQQFPSCLNDAIVATEIPSFFFFEQCRYLLTVAGFVLGGTSQPAMDDPNPLNYVIPTSVLLILYFGLPLAFFIVVIMTRQMLYRKFSQDEDTGKQSSLEEGRREPSTLDDSEEMPVPIYLSFHRLTYAVKLNKAGVAAAKAANGGKTPTKPGWDKKKILKNITGCFRPGTLSAIMGPSGCGKSTLLDVLADRKQGGSTIGKVLVNGRPRGPLFKRLSGYVMQFDALFPFLTVRESLMYTAELRLPGTNWKEKRESVTRVIHQLDLTRVADNRVGGGGVPGISGGQARRVTVGLELVTRPLILFLDEPTTGLDAFSSLNLVRTLRLLADTGRTVIATIHQPRPDIFDLFNTLLLMKDGEIGYFGKVKKIRPYFATLGIIIPEKENVADFVVDMTYARESSEEEDEAQNQVEKLADSYSTSKTSQKLEDLCRQLEDMTLPNLPPPAAKQFVDCDEVTGEPKVASRQRFSQTIFMQIFILLRRSYKNISRDTTYFTNIALQMSQFLFFGLLFLGLRTQNPPSAAAGEKIGITQPNYLFIITKRAFLFQVMNTIMLIETVVIAAAFVEKKIFRREHASGAYSVFSYHMQFIIRFYVDAIWKGLLASILSYFFPPMNLTPSGGPFFFFAATLMVCSTMGSALAFLMVSLVPDAEGAANIHAQILGTFGLYSGFFLFANLLPVWMLWLYYMLPFKYSFEALSWNEFECMTTGERDQLFALDPTLDRWGNLLVFMFYPPIFHGVAMLASFAHTRPQSYWVDNCSCCFSAEEVESRKTLGTLTSSEERGSALTDASSKYSPDVEAPTAPISQSSNKGDTNGVGDDEASVKLEMTPVSSAEKVVDSAVVSVDSSSADASATAPKSDVDQQVAKEEGGGAAGDKS